MKKLENIQDVWIKFLNSYQVSNIEKKSISFSLCLTQTQRVSEFSADDVICVRAPYWLMPPQRESENGALRL